MQVAFKFGSVTTMRGIVTKFLMSKLILTFNPFQSTIQVTST